MAAKEPVTALSRVGIENTPVDDQEEYREGEGSRGAPASAPPRERLILAGGASLLNHRLSLVEQLLDFLLPGGLVHNTAM